MGSMCYHVSLVWAAADGPVMRLQQPCCRLSWLLSPAEDSVECARNNPSACKIVLCIEHNGTRGDKSRVSKRVLHILFRIWWAFC